MGTHPIFESDFDCLTDMSAQETELGGTLIGLNFGPELGELAQVIGGADFLSLKQIQLRVDSFSKPLLIKSANTDIRPLLATLVWNNLAEFKNVKGSIQYRIIVRNALRYIQLPRYLFHINEIFGGKGSQIIKILLLRGRMEAGEITELLASQDPNSEALMTEVRTIFNAMVSNRFLKKHVNEENQLPETVLSINFNRSDPSKYKDEPNSAHECLVEYWSVKHDRFMHYIKDQMMVEFSSKLCGDFAALVFRNVLRFCELDSNAESVESKITLMDIRKSCNEADIDFSGFPLETVLDLLVKAEFMNKDGGSFTVRVRHTIEKMMIESILHWIGTKYGRDARKIVALLIKGNYMEPKMIAKKCVMDEKEAKKMIYRLLADGILQIQDISATGNLSQAKYSIYLFHSDQLQLGKLFRKKNLLAQKNMAVRLNAEFEKVKLLLVKQAKYEKLLLERHEVGENTETDDLSLLPRELDLIDKFKKAETRMLTVLLSLEQQLQLTDLFIFYRRQRMAEAIERSKSG